MTRSACVGLLLAAACLCGCSALETSSDFRGVTVDRNVEPVAVVAAENSGWYLFGRLPMITGDPERPGHVRFFHDTVTLENNVRMVAAKARLENATNIVNLTSRVHDDLAIGLFVFGRRLVVTSAVIAR